MELQCEMKRKVGTAHNVETGSLMKAWNRHEQKQDRAVAGCVPVLKFSWQKEFSWMM
jgi:hypothetical protein